MSPETLEPAGAELPAPRLPTAGTFRVPRAVNPEAIGDRDQTPIVYVGDLAELLGIPERSATHSGELSQPSNEGDNHG